MPILKGIYHNGMIDLIDKPKTNFDTEILVIFPDIQKKIVKIGGLFKKDKIDFDQMIADLKELNSKSEENLLKGF